MIVLAGCVKSKKPGRHPARELYTSRLFEGRRRYAEAKAERWFVLSALHGLLLPDQLVDCYEQSMASLSRAQRRGWSEDVRRRLMEVLGGLDRQELEIHAGVDYWQWGLRESLVCSGATVRLPLEGLGLGEQLHWYKGMGF